MSDETSRVSVEWHVECRDPNGESTWYYQGAYRRLDGAMLALNAARADVNRHDFKHEFRIVERTVIWKVLDL